MSRKRKAIVTSIVAAAVLVAFVVLVVFKKSPWQHRRTLRYCATPDCVAHAQMLTAQLNQSVHPCEDFYAYVCSSWGRSGLSREHIKTPVDQMSIARMSHFGAMLNRGTLKLRVGAKALALYESCMSGREGEGLSVERFRALMRDMNLYWPEPPPRNLSPLEVHLTLSCKWRVHLLLQVWVLAVPDTGKWRVVLQTAPLVPVALNHYRIVKESGGYRAYWKGFYITMRTNTTAQEDDASIEAAISETNDLDDAVLNRLSQFIFDQPQNPASFQLGSIGAHARHVTKDMWIRALQKSANVNPPLGASDNVLITSDRLLDTIDGIFENYTHSQLLMHVAWLFVQFYSPIAEPSLLLSHFGDANLASIYRSVFCAAHVEASYKVLVLSLDIASHITPEDQQAVVGGFERLVSAAVDTINNSTWLDDDSKQIARQKLTSVRLEAWPSEQLQTNAQLENIYARYPDEGNSFADIWVRTRRAIHFAAEKVRHTNESQEYYELLTLPMNMAPSYPYYSYALQTLKVPIYAINNPLYYRRGTDAMFYGGLGYLLALNLVKALDKIGVRWHLNGTNVDFILSDGDRDAFEEKNSCLKEEGADSVFPELPALEVAYSAMQSVHTTDLQDLGDDLGSAKVFFLTLCFMACSLPGFKSAFTVDCNRVVRNSPAFANAFACSDKAKMNPAKKCGFFA